MTKNAFQLYIKYRDRRINTDKSRLNQHPLSLFCFPVYKPGQPGFFRYRTDTSE